MLYCHYDELSLEDVRGPSWRGDNKIWTWQDDPADVAEDHIYLGGLWLSICDRVDRPLAASQKATNLRDQLQDHGNLSGACQKVIVCLYIILPSYNMYLITF